jgi:hypothetical protein
MKIGLASELLSISRGQSNPRKVEKKKLEIYEKILALVVFGRCDVPPCHVIASDVDCELGEDNTDGVIFEKSIRPRPALRSDCDHLDSLRDACWHDYI